MVLPPRSPQLMPLDASLWKVTDKALQATALKGMETKAHFLKRLRRGAMTLPEGTVLKYSYLISIISTK